MAILLLSRHTGGKPHRTVDVIQLSKLNINFHEQTAPTTVVFVTRDLSVHSYLRFIRHELLRKLFSPHNLKKNGYIPHY